MAEENDDKQTLHEYQERYNLYLQANATEIPRRKLEREFWERCVIEYSDMDIAHAVRCADEAVAEWRKRFAEPPQPSTRDIAVARLTWATGKHPSMVSEDDIQQEIQRVMEGK